MPRYFAYGSNMLTARLRARCPGARALGRAWLAGHRVGLEKRGRDGTAKATLRGAPGAMAHGVLFDLPAAELTILDRFEGLGQGYDRIAVTCVTPAHGRLDAVSYIASEPVRGLAACDWYLALIVAGAREHGLPEAVRDWYRAQPRVADRTSGGHAIAVAALMAQGALEDAERDLGTRLSLREGTGT